MSNDKVGATFHGGEDEPRHIEVHRGLGEEPMQRIPHHAGVDMDRNWDRDWDQIRVRGSYSYRYGRRDPLSFYSPADGKVVGVSRAQGYVILRERWSWKRPFRKRPWWTFSRLTGIEVQVGDRVTKGQLIGRTGRTS